MDAVSAETVSTLSELSADKPEQSAALSYISDLCLLRAGYPIEPEVVLFPPSTSGNLPGVSLFSSVETAKEHGYPSSIKPHRSSYQILAESLDESGRQKLEAALFGAGLNAVSYTSPSGSNVTTTADGCFGEALATVYGSPKNYLRLSTVRAELSSHGPVNQQTPPGIESYRQCMEEEGFSADTPKQAAELAASRFGESRDVNAPVPKGEINLASADAECQLEAGFLQFYTDEYLTAAEDWLVSNTEWIEGMRQLDETASIKAAEILTAATGT